MQLPVTPITCQTTEDLIAYADSIKRQAYWDTVRAIVDDAADQVKAGDITETDGLTEWLEQTIDGHHDVIYTYAAQEVLRYSENDGAYVDDFGAEGVVTDGSINWSVLAYCALLADVREQIGDEEAFLSEHEPTTEDTPEEEDIYANDPSGPFSYLGKVIANDRAELRAWMTCEGYSPNVWWTSDHGNQHQILDLDDTTEAQ